MRLTLRTMLAYMDEILDPADQEEIGKKIQHSEFAADLLHRTRDVMRRLRLGAPQLSGKGMGLDPNTVAEYLDNSLSPERVADFERVCLESDVHLAEVAASHQILTLVLGEPADIDPETRRKMYDIPTHAERLLQSRLDSPHTLTSAADGAVAQEPTERVRRRAKAPDYLRESNGSRVRKMAAWLVVAAAIVGLALFLTGPDGPFGAKKTPPVSDEGQLARSDSPTGSADSSSSSSTEAADGAPLRENGSESVEANAGGAPVPGPNGKLDRLPPVKPDTKDGGAVGEAGSGTPPGTSLETPAGDTSSIPDAPRIPPAIPSGAGDALPVEPAGGTDAEAAVGRPAVVNPIVGDVGPTLSPPPSAAGVGPGLAPPANAAVLGPKIPEAPEPGALDGAVTALPGIDDTPIDGLPAVEAASSRVGTFVTENDVLLRYQPDQREWWRLAAMEPLMSGDQLLALPTYRPAMTLGGGATLKMVDGTRIALLGEARDASIALDLLYGRVWINNPTKKDMKIRLGLGGSEERTFIELAPNAELAVEVTRPHTPGADPETTPTPPEAHLVALTGTVRQIEEGGPRELLGLAEWSLRDGKLIFSEAAASPPAWTQSADISTLEKIAANYLRQALKVNQSSELTLRELVDGHHNNAIRSLASRSSLYVGKFEPFVSALNDGDIAPASVPKLIRDLRDAMSLGPDAAKDIQSTFVRRRGEEEGQLLYRMLWGYTSEDLEQGARQQLVGLLRHDRLDVRLLALWNLAEVTGLDSDVKQRLVDPTKNNQQIIRRWESRLKEGKIVPRANAPASP